MARIKGFQSLLLVLFYLTSTFARPLLGGPRVKRHTSQLRPYYDYIIAGGGTAGLTVADRLTEKFPDRNVLVVEAGGFGNESRVLLPGSFADPSSSFDITSVPQAGLFNRSFSVTVGKIVGGSSAINAQIFDRGSKSDYDAWGDVSEPFTSAYNDAGWNWEGLLPYFKKSVTFDEPSAADCEKYGYTYDVDAAYGGNGPIHASFPPFEWPTLKTIWKAWTEYGIDSPKEAAAGEAYGLIWEPSSQSAANATRSYARTGHYDAVSDRSNYDLLVNHKVSKIYFDGLSNKATSMSGVEIRPLIGHGPAVDRDAGREVILAAGGIHTPHVLQRSGVGPKDVLQKAGISVLVDLPGVGQNFQDHATASFFANLTKDLSPNSFDLFLNATAMAEAQRQYKENHTGPLTMALGGNAGAFLPLRTITDNWSSIISNLSAQRPTSYLPNDTHPTILAGYASQLQILQDLLSSSKAAAMEYPVQAGGSTIPTLLKPLSRGSVNINPADIDGEPLVNYRTFSNPIDVSVSIEAMKLLREIFTMPSAKALGPVELFPGATVQTDAQWETYLRQTMNPSFYHPVGTAALMPREAGGVVGPDLMVHGVDKVRVVDASVMPLIPGTHTSSTVYAVAEKAADIIIQMG